MRAFCHSPSAILVYMENSYRSNTRQLRMTVRPRLHAVMLLGCYHAVAMGAFVASAPMGEISPRGRQSHSDATPYILY